MFRKAVNGTADFDNVQIRQPDVAQGINKGEHNDKRYQRRYDTHGAIWCK